MSDRLFQKDKVMDEHDSTAFPQGSFPLLRIWLCGPVRMEWSDPTCGEVVPILNPMAGGRDQAATLSLLALLICQPHRQAHRDWVMEQFWPEGGRSVAVHRLENIFSSLRKVLRPPSGGESLARSTIGKKTSGPRYCLETYPKIWVDLDALTWQVEQAARMERFHDHALPFWERAFELAQRGPFLVDTPYEPYATWIEEQQARLDGYTRQCVHALARLYGEKHSDAGKAEALLLLRTYWQQHKTDEDALRPLLELLGEQERYQEAKEYYQQLLIALADLGPGEEGIQPRLPDARTRDIHEYLRTKQLQREHRAQPTTYVPTNRAVSLERQTPSSMLDPENNAPIHAEAIPHPATDIMSRSEEGKLIIPIEAHPQNTPSNRRTEWTIPLPPHTYIAHPYPLQENFTGRKYERRFLSAWMIKDPRPLCVLSALGGMGKSALAWTWLQQDVLTLSDARPEGIFWWSFYESEAFFSTFLNQALIYTSRGTIDPKNIPSLSEKIQALIHLLQQHRFLFILDGFERELRAYESITSVTQNDTFHEDRRETFRACTDPHISSFLRWLAASPLHSKVLLTSRLFPYELDGLGGCWHKPLQALDQEDAIAFLRAQGIRGTRIEIQSACAYYGNHPLTLRLLAGVVVNDPAQPGDINVATEYSLIPEMVQREHHVLTYAYEALDPALQNLLSRVAAFRSTVDFEMLKIISPLKKNQELKGALRELVERGMLFFDRERGRYDLHTVVRQFAYSRLQRKEEVHHLLAAYFQSKSKDLIVEHITHQSKNIQKLFIPSVSSIFSHIEDLEELANPIELCHHLIQASEFEEAFQVYYHNLGSILYHRFGAYRTIIELLQAFFLDETAFSHVREYQKSWLLDALALAYSASGYPLRAAQLLKDAILIDREVDDQESLAIALWNLAVQQLMLGKLTDAEQNLQESISRSRANQDIFNEAKAHQYIALLRAYQGAFKDASLHLDTSLALFRKGKAFTSESAVWAYRALCKLLEGKISTALLLAQQASELAKTQRFERDIIRSEWLVGLITTHIDNQGSTQTSDSLSIAELHLKEALTRCQRIDMVDYEADLLSAWAKICLRKGDYNQAKNVLGEALSIAERSDFRVLRADIHNLIARLELEQGNIEEAAMHAHKAFEDASCDGNPYCYIPALKEAETILSKVMKI